MNINDIFNMLDNIYIANNDLTIQQKGIEEGKKNKEYVGFVSTERK